MSDPYHCSQPNPQQFYVAQPLYITEECTTAKLAPAAVQQQQIVDAVLKGACNRAAAPAETIPY